LTTDQVEELISLLENFRKGCRVTTLAEVEKEKRSPYHLLVACIISLRTKDEVTAASAARLFVVAPNPEKLGTLREEEIARAIYPAGFYRRKAKQLRVIGQILVEDFGSKVPDTRKELLSLPGVGRKTANLVLGLGFGIPTICVDTHVHRIPNRLGLIDTRRPEQTETALEALLPRSSWIDINDLLVTFGQNCCRPISPHCSTCTLRHLCNQKGVGTFR